MHDCNHYVDSDNEITQLILITNQFHQEHNSLYQYIGEKMKGVGGNAVSMCTSPEWGLSTNDAHAPTSTSYWMTRLAALSKH